MSNRSWMPISSICFIFKRSLTVMTVICDVSKQHLAASINRSHLLVTNSAKWLRGDDLDNMRVQNMEMEANIGSSENRTVCFTATFSFLFLMDQIATKYDFIYYWDAPRGIGIVNKQFFIPMFSHQNICPKVLTDCDPYLPETFLKALWCVDVHHSEFIPVWGLPLCSYLSYGEGKGRQSHAE